MRRRRNLRRHPRESPGTGGSLGDLVGYGTFPNGAVEFVRERGVPTIAGNYDEGVGANSDDCGCAYQTEIGRQRADESIAWTNEAITGEDRRYLRTLNEHIALEFATAFVPGRTASSASALATPARQERPPRPPVLLPSSH